MNAFLSLYIDGKKEKDVVMVICQELDRSDPQTQKYLEQILLLLFENFNKTETERLQGEKNPKVLPVLKRELLTYVWVIFENQYQTSREKNPQIMSYLSCFLRIMRVALAVNPSWIDARQFAAFYSILDGMLERDTFHWHIVEEITAIAELLRKIPQWDDPICKIVSALVKIILLTQGTEERRWYNITRLAIRIIYGTQSYSEIKVTYILQKLSSFSYETRDHLRVSESHASLKIEDDGPSMETRRGEKLQRMLSHYLYCFGEVCITHSVYFEDLYTKMDEQLGKDKQITDENADILGVNVEKQSKRKFPAP